MAFDGTAADGEPVGPHQVLGAGVVQGGMCAPVDGLAGPGQGRKFPGVAGVGLVPGIVPVSVWKVGGLGVAALPSEVTKQMGQRIRRDRKSTRLNSSHANISYAVFCLKKTTTLD